LETKHKILIAARKEFLAKGYERASLRVIGKDAGFTAGLIYSYFKDKDDLFDAVVGKVKIHLRWASEHREEFAMVVERELSQNDLLIKRLATLNPIDLEGMLWGICRGNIPLNKNREV